MAENEDGNNPPQDEGTKTVPLKELVAKRKALASAEARIAELESRIEEAESGKLSDIDRLKKENEKLQKALSGHVQSTRRQVALEKAMAEIGEGFHIDDKAKSAVKILVDAAAFDEKTIDDVARAAVEMAKRPIAQTHGAPALKGMPAVGQFGKSETQAPPVVSSGPGVKPYELAVMAANDPEKYAQTLADLQAGKLQFAN